MTYKIDEIEGIGSVIAHKFVSANIKTVEQLLEAGASKPGRKKLAETTGKELVRNIQSCSKLQVLILSKNYLLEMQLTYMQKCKQLMSKKN